MSAYYEDGQYLPGTERPRGLRFFLGTWSGRILTINAVVFIAISLVSGNLFMPSETALMAFGIKDPVALASGEIWRLVTPMFLHIGLIHFGMNSLMLFVIGYQLESLLGRWWFLAIYLTAGVAGNVASGVFSVVPSAGASGAIFGLLGCGFFLERAIGKLVLERTGSRPKHGVYSATVILNVALGFMIPMIDNAAHLGGLVAGVVLTYAMLCLRPNRLRQQQRGRGLTVLAAFAALLLVGGFLATDTPLVAKRLEKAGDEAEDLYMAITHYSGALRLKEDGALHCKRGRVALLFSEELQVRLAAFHDLRRCLSLEGVDALVDVEAELRTAGRSELAQDVQRMIDVAKSP